MAKDALGHGSDGKGEHSGKVDALPPKQTGNSQELKMFADNDGNLYRQSQQPIEKNLDKRIANGTYDHAKSLTLWGYHADKAAQAYHKQFGSPGTKWHEMFSPGDRRAAAAGFASDFKSERGLK